MVIEETVDMKTQSRRISLKGKGIGLQTFKNKNKSIDRFQTLLMSGIR